MTETVATQIPSTETLRRGDIPDLVQMLQTQRAQSVDVVVDASRITFERDQLFLQGFEPQLNESGVTDVNGFYKPTSIADEGLASKLDIPLSYLRKCRTGDNALYAENINGWLKHEKRRFLLRLLRGQNGLGIMRAFLSDTYRTIDNLDALLALLDGLHQSGVKDPVIQCDLTERRMVVRVAAPEIAAYAPKLLEGYRSPFDGTDVSRGWTPARIQALSRQEGQQIEGGGEVVFAGFICQNSEVGGGAYTIAPQLIVKVCGNGLTLDTSESVRKVHVGGKLEDGIQWSEKTQKLNLEMITSMTADAVNTYLDVDFITRQVTKLEEITGIAVPKPDEVIANVSKKLGFTESQADDILAHFIRGGQTTVGGVMQAVTSAAQIMSNGDTALAMENSAVKAMHLAKDLVLAGK